MTMILSEGHFLYLLAKAMIVAKKTNTTISTRTINTGPKAAAVIKGIFLPSCLF
jgi:hypothetical protein